MHIAVVLACAGGEGAGRAAKLLVERPAAAKGGTAARVRRPLRPWRGPRAARGGANSVRLAELTPKV
eukprot:4525188-Lingulodinium_polyedra.AAC.1